MIFRGVSFFYLSTMVRIAVLVVLICASIAADIVPWGYTRPVCKRANEVPRTDKGCWRTCADKNALPDKDCEFHLYFPPLCQCKNGFYRADNGECVTYDQCAAPKPVYSPFTFEPLICTGANEYASNADKSCERTCEGRDGPGFCYTKLVFPGNCLCNSGFYRAENGECVTYEQCGQHTVATTVSQPSVCPPNEGLSQSHKLCEPTCEHKNGPRTCPLVMIRPEHCLCRKGFYRAYILESAHRGVILASAAVSKAAAADYEATSRPRLDPIFDFLFKTTPPGNNIVPSQSPNSASTASLNCTVANEAIVTSHPTCWRTCEKRNRHPVCFKSHYYPTCQCKSDFFRSKNGQCVTLEQCPKQSHPTRTVRPLVCTRANEFVSRSMASCQRTCGNKDRKFIPCGRAIVAPNCQCIRGFYRAKNGECVTYDQCAKQDIPTPRRLLHIAPVCTRANEALAQSAKSCDRTCQNRSPLCNKSYHILGNCQCAFGFYRAENGECVTVDQCP